LIELLVVIAIVALASAAVTLAVRDPQATQLEREAARLSALLESARAEARASGLAVFWVPTGPSAVSGAQGLVGLPSRASGADGRSSVGGVEGVGGIGGGLDGDVETSGRDLSSPWSSVASQVQGQDASGSQPRPPDFRFVGLPPAIALPRHWLAPGVSAIVVGSTALRLGPEPLIPAQRVVLSLGPRRLVLATDGLAPFAVDAVPDGTRDLVNGSPLPAGG
jgi:type II secretory pathway pseudopilin PulG